MQEACHEPRNRPRSLWSLYVSVVRASGREIPRSEVQFHMGTQKFFFVPRSWRDEIKSFSIECLSWKLNWPIWLVRYQDDYFFPIWRYFAYAWTYYYLASAGLSYNVVKNMYKWVLEFGRVVLQIHFFVISLTNAAKKKKEMKKLPISNPLPKKRFEADLKYNSWRSLFLKTPLIELWLVWRD